MVDSRETESKEAIRRRRECIACGQRFTTYEKIEEIPITVVKRDGSTELFHPEKLLQGSDCGPAPSGTCRWSGCRTWWATSSAN